MNTKRPFLINLGMIWFGGNAFFSLILLPLITFSQDTVIYDNVEMSTSSFVVNELPYIISYGIVTAIITYGFLKRKLWSKHAISVFWVYMCLYALLTVDAKEDLISFVTGSGIAGIFSIWYFYYKSNVVAFYKTIRDSNFKERS